MSNRARLTLSIVVLVFAGLLATALFFSDDDSDDAKDTEGLTNQTLFLTFIPNIQFAPVYVAIEKGYFKDEGLNITIEHGDEADGVDRLAINDLQFGIISGEQVILGRNAEKPLVYVMEWYHRFPVGVVVPADSSIETAADLEGHSIGLPFFNGASYIGFRALLSAVDLQESDVSAQAIGFTAPAIMCEKQIDAAVVYIANEPLQIEACFDVRVIEISDYVSLVSNGLVTNAETIEQHPDLVAKMVKAIQRGIADTVADPNAAFDLSLKYVPDLSEDQYEVQREVLRRSTDLWQSDTIGVTTTDAWEATQQTLIDTQLIDGPLADLSSAYTNRFVED